MQKDELIDKEAPTAAGAPAPEAQRASAKRNVDTELRLDGEPDTLYDDDLDVDKSAGELAGARGDTPGIAKP